MQGRPGAGRGLQLDPLQMDGADWAAFRPLHPASFLDPLCQQKQRLDERVTLGE